MTDWASNTNYADLSGDLAEYNGLATKVVPDDYANGFAPKSTFEPRKLNYLFDELKDTIAVAVSSGVPTTRTLTAGNGLDGGGDLSADRSFSVELDGASLAVSASGLKVNVLATDAQHGDLALGDGTLHAAATNAVAGFLSAAQKTTLQALVTASAAAAFACIEPTTTGTQNDYAPTGWDGADMVLFANASALTINGFAAPTSTGKWVKYLTCGAGDVTLVDEAGGSVAANRIRVPTASDSGASTFTGWILAYGRSAGTPRWHVVAQLGAA